MLDYHKSVEILIVRRNDCVEYHTNARDFTPSEISSTRLYDGTLYFTLYLTLSHLAVKSRAHCEQWEVDWHIPTLLRVGSHFILSHYTQRPCGSLHTCTWTKGVFSPNSDCNPDSYTMYMVYNRMFIFYFFINESKEEKVNSFRFAVYQTRHYVHFTWVSQNLHGPDCDL